MTPEYNYFVASKHIRIPDATHNIEFDTWFLYPSIQPAQETACGPYTVYASQEGNIAPGKFPLLIISHGGGGSHFVYRSLAAFMAENGFVVAMPKHYGDNRDDKSLDDLATILGYRTHHIHIMIDYLTTQPDISSHIDFSRIYMAGHSMGGATALSVAGAIPWSKSGQYIPVTHDKRVSALVLFASANAWFQHPDSLKNVDVPMLQYIAERDNITPPWQADVLSKGIKPHLLQHRIVANANHFAFVTPFPLPMRRKSFAPSQDPEGFDRAAFQEVLKREVLSFLNSTANKPDDCFDEANDNDKNRH